MGKTIPAKFLLVISVLSLVSSLFAADVPAELPKPDKTPPKDGKVKVYVLAGQSNMVGFGTLNPARPVYSSIYLSADPIIVPCRMPVGNSALLPLKVYQSAAADSAKGAKVAIYQGEYKPGMDISKMTPVKETVFPLGKVTEKLPTIDAPHITVAKTFIEVPETGMFEVYPGYKESSYAIATLDGKEVYRKDIGKERVVNKVKLERDKRYPVTITYLKGGSGAFYLKQIDLKGKGDLTTAVKEGKFPWFVDNEGKWTVRNDVTYWETRCSKKEGGSGGPLSVTSNGKFIGPEVPFGYIMGTYHDEPVLLIESSIGNRALSFDFRPPSSPKTDEEKADKYCGFEYNALVKGVKDTLKNIDKIVPNYKGQGYEIVGFVWWQGHKDNGKTKEEYEKHLVNLIKDLRKDLNAPNMKVVVGTVGFHGFNLPEGWKGVFDAQMAVSDPKQHPEFAEEVATVDTRSFWRSRANSPTGVDYHYNKNAETYVLTGDALGREMVKMLGGKAEDLKLPPKKPLDPNVEKILSNDIVNTYSLRSKWKYGNESKNPTKEEYAKMAPALAPIILEDMVPAFIESAFGTGKARGIALKSIVTGKKPKKIPTDIKSQLDTLISYYDAAGIPEYEWKQFGPVKRHSKWYYYSFDPPEKQPFNKSDRLRKITLPQGMENWNQPGFDPVAAGWKEGTAPFGQMDGKLETMRPECYQPLCGCDEKPKTLWEKEVLLMTQTFDLPPAKKGHAYRVILGGAGCDRTGEGFAVYVNGKLLTQSKGGFFRNEGVRGGYVFEDILPEFKGGKVTISVMNFLRYTYFRNKTTYHGPNPAYQGKTVPPNGHVSLWIEEAELPPEVMAAAKNTKAEPKKGK